MAYLPNTISLWNPNENTPMTPIQNLFTESSGSVKDTLVLMRKDAPFAVSSDTTRNNRFPSPSQGDRVFNESKQYEEIYYELRTASNRKGANVAGWYPAPGAAVATYRTSNYSKASGASYLSVGKSPMPFTNVNDPHSWRVSATPEFFRPSITGEYLLSVNVIFERKDMNGWRAVEVRKPDGTVVANQTVEPYSVGANTGLSLSIPLVSYAGSNDAYEVLIYQNSGAALSVTVTVSLTFIAPVRSN